MTFVHVNIQTAQHHNLKKWENPRLVNETGNVETDGSCIECEQIGVFHQWPTTLQEMLAQWGWQILCIAVSF